MRYGETINYCRRVYGKTLVNIKVDDEFTRIEVKKENKDDVTLEAYGWMIMKTRSGRWSAHMYGEKGWTDFNTLIAAKAYVRNHPKEGSENDIRPSKNIKATLDREEWLWKKGIEESKRGSNNSD